MKNAKYLLVIAAFVTLAFVGFSAFVPSADYTTAAGKTVAVQKMYVVWPCIFESHREVEKVFLNEAEADTYASQRATTNVHSLYIIKEAYGTKSEIDQSLRGGTGW